MQSEERRPLASDQIVGTILRLQQKADWISVSRRVGRQDDDQRDERAIWRYSEESAGLTAAHDTESSLTGNKMRYDELGARFGRQKWLGEDEGERRLQASGTSSCFASKEKRHIGPVILPVALANGLGRMSLPFGLPPLSQRD